MPKENPNEAYNEWMVVFRQDGDIMETRRAGRRGETWDAPELNIAPPVTNPPVPLRRLARQGHRARHAGRVIPILDEAAPMTQNPSILYHAITMAVHDAAAGHTRGQLEDDTMRRQINLVAMVLSAAFGIGTVIKVMFL